MKYLIIALIVLTGCTPKAINTPVPVDVPVAVPCHADMPEAPEWKVPAARAAALPDQVIAMASDLDSAHGYIEELQAAVSACQ